MLHVVLTHETNAQKSKLSHETQRGKPCARAAHSGPARLLSLMTSLFRRGQTQEVQKTHWKYHTGCQQTEKP